MAHNEVPVVTRITVDGAERDLQGVTLKLQLNDATGPVGKASEQILDLAAGQPTRITNVGSILDPAAMLQVEEQRAGWISATVESNGTLLAERSVAVRLLAAHQWLATPLELGLEMLAAHVTPNHPAITELLPRVADRLGAATGIGSIEGYQSGPERVDEIVRATYECVQDLGIRYSEPPASWADHGQKVRTPGEVLETRIGTCLDLVVVLAAALEQAGIRPLLWVVEGHAFLGYWREPATLGATAVTEVAHVVNRVDLGQIGLVEATALTAREPRIPFDRAHELAYAHLADLSRVIGVTDVHQARRDRILPLPARTRTEDGSVLVSVYRPDPATSLPSKPHLAAGTSPAPGSNGRGEPPARVARWKNALLDLSLRNRLINYTSRSGLSLAVPGDQLGHLEDLLHAGQAVSLYASDEITAMDLRRGTRSARDLPDAHRAELLTERRSVYADVTEAAYAKRLRALAHRARTILEETGANNLYLALGSLVWELEGKSLRSPLILVPVSLRAMARGGRYRLVLDEAGSSTPNYCLIEKLRQVHGMTIPGLAEPALDDSGIDLDGAFDATRAAIAERGLAYRVEPTSDLAILQFAKFRLWKDLDEAWETLARNRLVDHLIRTPADAFGDPVEGVTNPDLDGFAERCPIPADSSQLRAVHEAAAGRTFVLEGPPGTGKSQTITNLLAVAVAEGKRVLFVAEKRAALDVVRKRLDSIGLGPLSLDLHDKGSRPNAVREQIKRALDHTVYVDQQGLTARLGDLQAARRRLNRYASRLHEPNRAMQSAYSARDTELAIGPEVPELPIPQSFLGSAAAGAVDEIRQLLRMLPDLTEQVRPRPDHPWAFIDSVGAEAPDVRAVLSAARGLDTAITALPAQAPLHEVYRVARWPADIHGLADLFTESPALELLDETRTARWNQAAEEAMTRVMQFADTAHAGLDSVTPVFLGLPLADIDAAARQAASSGFFGRKKRLIAVRDQLGPALREGAQVPPKKVPELSAALVAIQRQVAQLAASVVAIPGLTLPDSWNPFTFAGREAVDSRVRWLRWAGTAVDPGHSDANRALFASALRELLASNNRVDPAPIAHAAEATEGFVRACRVDPSVLAEWAGSSGLLAAWERTRSRRGLGDEDLTSLREWLQFLATLEPLRAAHFVEARRLLLSGELDADDAIRSFELGLARTSLSERLAATGLDQFDVEVHERSVERFLSAFSDVRAHLETAVPDRVLRTRTFNPAAGGRVGELTRELGRKRGGLKIRDLLTKYGDLITGTMPCVLVSPDSVARFFPASAALFDIVVFDEASQVRVADAIGAIGRARSVVVVGDSEQMPPTSFGESTLSDADLDTEFIDDEVVEDEESILTETVQARVPRHRLRWHYRSQDESLIAFSNHHHYEGELASFPAPPAEGTGVSMVRVDGQFHRSGKGALLRTNPLEAEAVVDEIRRRFDASPKIAPSIGVVTFNQQQRAYLEGLLRDSNDTRLIEALEEPDGLFVKNLENVQGDERDVILFSTAFSVNAKGVLPLNFGPLNRSGGERRLNVAVTRARRQVIVFSSFDPEQLRAEQTSSVGIRNLRTYLEMAARGPQVLPNDPRRRATPDRHRDQIADALRARGLSVRTDVGLSGFKVDLTLASQDEPDAPRVAVLLDGPAWAARGTAHDRDGLPREVLARMLRWPAVERVWLPAWLADPQAVMSQLEQSLSSAGRHAQPTETAPAPAIRREPPINEALLGQAPPDPFDPLPSANTFGEPAKPRSIGPAKLAAVTPSNLDATNVFVPWRMHRFGDVSVLDALPSPQAARWVADALTEIVSAEGPIHTERLGRLTGLSFGLSKVVGNRRTAIFRHLPRSLVRDGDEPVVWPPSLDPQTWTQFRTTPEGVDRPLEHVPLREIVNAMVVATRESAGIRSEELHRAVLSIFGFRRLTAGFVQRLDTALALGVRSGRLVVDNVGIVLPGPGP
ncbi:MAG TPA: DUF4011 domain-containing protein [Kribbella sp.]